jgi:hypothetical protein
MTQTVEILIPKDALFNIKHHALLYNSIEDVETVISLFLDHIKYLEKSNLETKKLLVDNAVFLGTLLTMRTVLKTTKDLKFHFSVED